MKKLLLILSLFSIFSLTGYGAESKILIAYFTRTNNTEKIAEMIQEYTKGDIFKIEVLNPYPEAYRATTDQAKKELESGYLPPLKSKIENLDSYDTIFIGYPIWWGTVPTPMRTFLSENDLSGKTIIPFCTHGGGGAGTSTADLTALAPKFTVVSDGYVTRNAGAGRTQGEVTQWLDSLKDRWNKN